MKKYLAIILTVMLLLSAIPLGTFSVSAVTSSISATISSGTTGDCTWTLDDNGVLTISGNGNMGTYSNGSAAPWGKYITEVVISSGVTSIGDYAFFGCTGLTSIAIPNSVKGIGWSAFTGCANLKDVYYSGTEEEWGE